MDVTLKQGPGPVDSWPQPLQDALMDGFAFTSRVFWGPEIEFCSALYQGDGLSFLQAPLLRPFLKSSGSIVDKIGAATRSYENGEALFQSLEAEYVTLFISNQQGIAAPLYHSCYAGPEYLDSPAMLMGEPALGMKKRLASSGLVLSGEFNHPPDHLCIEIEYLYFLLKEGWAGEGKEQLAEGQAFAGEWMLPWVRQFQDRLRPADQGGLYTLVAGLLVDLLEVING